MLLALTLLPNLQSTPNSRLVCMSSDLHRAPLSSTKFASLEEINNDIGPNSLYARTKLAQILFVRAMVRRMENNEPGFQSPKYLGPWVNATHPGGVKTDQQEQAVDAYGTKGKVGVMAVRPFLKDPVDEGCRSALFAATSEAVVTDAIQGQYVRHSSVPLVTHGSSSADAYSRSSPIAKSPTPRSKLRTRNSARICGG